MGNISNVFKKGLNVVSISKMKIPTAMKKEFFRTELKKLK